MCQQPYYVHIRRIDPTRNMARFYELSIGSTLFGDVSLTRSWGRIGTRGQSRVHLLESEQVAVELFLDLLKQKRRNGYRSRPSTDYGNDGWLDETTSVPRVHAKMVGSGALQDGERRLASRRLRWC